MNPDANPVAPLELPYATFGQRVVASLLDGMVLTIVDVAILIIASLAHAGSSRPVQWFVYWISPMIYSLAFWCTTGATPGKRLLGLRVATRDGVSPLPVGKALLRYIGYWISTLPLLIGYLWPLWHPKRQALHDLIAGTVVLRPTETAEGRSSTLKWVVGLIAGAVLLGGIAIAALVVWLRALPRPTPAQIEQRRLAAETFGRAHTAQECFTEGLSKIKACAGLACQVEVQMFTTESLKYAKDRQAFCAEVPRSSAILATSLWIQKTCPDGGSPWSSCSYLLQAVSRSCESPATPSPEPPDR